MSILICFSIKLMNLIALQQIHQNNDSIQSQEMVATELRLVRTILEWLECAYAIQEAKLDRLLNMMPNAPAVLQQPVQFQPSFPSTQSSTPLQSNSSVEYRAPETGSSALPVIQRFVDDTKATFTRYRTNFRPVQKLTVCCVRTEPCNIFALFRRN